MASPATGLGLREATLRGLRREPKALPTVWLYDERGSQLYEEITRLPEYYLPRREREIDLRERLIDLRDAGRLFVRSSSDVLHELRGPANRRHEIGKQRARTIGDAHAVRRQRADLA